MKRAIGLAGFILFINLATGVSWPETAQWQPPLCPATTSGLNPNLKQLMRAPQPPYTLQPGDDFEVLLYGVPRYDVKGRVAIDGKVVLPLLGQVTLRDLTIEEADAMIAGKLERSGMFVSPQVNMVLLDSPNETVSLTGEIAKPGTYPDHGRHALYQFIATACGFTKTACHMITLKRRSLNHYVQTPMGANPLQSKYAKMPIFTGDSIMVRTVGVIYVVGALKSQGAYPLKPDSPTTVIQAITMAGGVRYQAANGSTVVIRQVTDGQEQISLNLKRIFAGKQADVVLRPNDILFVPSSNMKAALKGGAAGVATGLAPAHIYSHP